MSEDFAPATIAPALAGTDPLQSYSSLELAQALAAKLAISPKDWHRLNRDRRVRAQEQLAAAMVYLLKDQPEEVVPRLTQAIGWLDRSISAPPCPSHGPHRTTS